MKRSKFSEEQIVYAIRQTESGTPVGDLCRQLGVSDATFYAWRACSSACGSGGASISRCIVAQPRSRPVPRSARAWISCMIPWPTGGRFGF